MQALKWTPSLWLGFDPMDTMNREFMERLGRAQAASDEQVLETWQALVQHVWPLLEQGRCLPVIHAEFPLERASEAHALMESSSHIGKIVLKVAA